MHRFYLPPAQCQTAPLMLSGREAHHALHVLRVQRGEQVTVLDGAGTQFACTVRNYDRDKVELAIEQKNLVPPLPYRIILLQAVPRGKIIESIIQKATELGVWRIVPLLTERVTAHLDERHAQRKVDKWQLVAVEAIKQCGSAWLPRIEAPLTPGDFLARNEKFELPLLASLQPGSRNAREYVQAFQSQHERLPESACVWIGPEGDFTPEELAAIQDSGALPVSLGRLVLRVETAAIYCLSILNHELSREDDAG